MPPKKPKNVPSQISFDPERLTIGQIEQLEDATGTPLAELIRQFQQQTYTAKTLKAVVWLLVAADDPEFTLEDAANLKLSALIGAVQVPPAVAPAQDA